MIALERLPFPENTLPPSTVFIAFFKSDFDKLSGVRFALCDVFAALAAAFWSFIASTLAFELESPA